MSSTDVADTTPTTAAATDISRSFGTFKGCCSGMAVFSVSHDVKYGSGASSRLLPCASSQLVLAKSTPTTQSTHMSRHSHKSGHIYHKLNTSGHFHHEITRNLFCDFRTTRAKVHDMNRYKFGGASKASASTLCQKCLKRGHYSYECTAAQQERPYVSRPSRTQRLLNPKLAPRITEQPK